MKDNEGNTPLHLASSPCSPEKYEQRFQVAKILVDADSSIVTLCNGSGETALSAATTGTDTPLRCSKLVELLQCPPETAGEIMIEIIMTEFNKELASTLIKCGAELNWNTASGTTWLHIAMAVKSKSLDAVRFFVERGIHPDVKDNLGNTPSHHALASVNCYFGSWFYDPSYVVKRLNFLNQLGADVKAVNNKGKSLLHLAAHQGSLAAVKYLLSMGCDVNAPGGSVGDTALQYCFMQEWCGSQFYVVELLLKNHSNVNAINTKGDTVADLAIKALRESVAESDLQPLDENNDLKFVEVIKLMIDQELDLMRKTTKGGNFLHHISSFLDSSEFHEVVEHVISKEKQETFHLLDDSNQNFVRAAQKHFTVLDETLSLVKCYGLDIHG